MNRLNSLSNIYMRKKIGVLSLAVIILSMAMLAQKSAWNLIEETANFVTISNSKVANVTDPISFEADTIEIDRFFPETRLDIPMWTPLPGMTDRDRIKVHRFIEPEAPQRVLQLSRQDLTKSPCFRLSSDGTLLFIAKQSKLEILEIPTGKIAKVIDTKLDMPLAIVDSKILDRVGLLGANTFEWYSMSENRLLFRIPLQSAANLQRAADDDVFIGVQRDGTLFRIDLESLSIVPFEGPKTLRLQFAISPNGSTVLSTSSKGLVRWTLKTNAIGFTELPSTDVKVETQMPAAGNTIQVWGSLHGIHLYQDEKYASVQKDEAFPYYHNVALQQAFVGHEASGFEWLVVLGKHLDRNNQTKNVLVDFKIADQSIRASGPMVLDAKAIDRIELSLDSKTIAYLDENALVILKRTEWSDPCGIDLIDYARELFYAGRFEMFEAIALDLRRRNFPSHWLTGEDLYSNFVERAAKCMLYISQHPEEHVCRDLAEPLTRWLDSGTELTKLASIAYVTKLGTDARGTVYASSVTKEGEESFNRHMKAARVIVVEEMLVRGDAAKYVHRSLSFLRLYGFVQQEAARELNQRGANKFRNDFDIYTEAVLDCLPRYHGQPGDAHRYIFQVANSYPKSFREKVYTLLALQLIEKRNEKIVDAGEANIELKRVFRPVASMIDASELDLTHTETLLKLALKNGFLQEAIALADYHIEKFSFPGRNTYTQPTLCFIMNRKDERCTKLGLTRKIEIDGKVSEGKVDGKTHTNEVLAPTVL